MTEQTEIQSTQEQEVKLANPFIEESWADAPVKVDEKADAPIVQETVVEEPVKTEQKGGEDLTQVLKEKLGFDDWETAATEISKLREQPKIGFENEESRKAFDYIKEQKEDELYKFLDEKRKIDRLANSDIKDTNTAAEIIKLNMFQKNKELDTDEIEFLFKEKFGKPEKPVQGVDELDSDYEERVSAWETKVNEVDKRLIIEAKLAKPELEKIKSSLVLPDINPKQVTPEPTQKELEERDNYVKALKGTVDETIKSFEGFRATVKDEESEFSVDYIPSDEEKKVVAEQLSYFVENNLDANMIFAERWVNDDGTVNVKQMTKDLLLIQNEGKITQKYVNEAANRKLANHLKRQANIHISDQPGGRTFSPDNQQSEMDKLAAVMFAK